MIHNVKISVSKAPKQYPARTKQFKLVCSACGNFSTLFGIGVDAELNARRQAEDHTRKN